MLNKISDSKLLKRALSAMVMMPVAVALIWFGGLPFTAFVGLCAAIALYEWIQLALKTKYRIPALLIGILYLGLTFWCCYWLRMGYSPQVALLFIGMIWMSDINAYFFGKLIGGPKMAEEISPNKTWAGLVGAVIGPMVLCLLFLFFKDMAINHFELVMAVIIGVAIGCIGQSGDLIVSFLKRQAGAKDTGDLIPGHGGLLDRIDAMLLAAPLFLFIVSQFSYVFIS